MLHYIFVRILLNIGAISNIKYARKFNNLVSVLRTLSNPISR